MGPCPKKGGEDVDQVDGVHEGEHHEDVDPDRGEIPDEALDDEVDTKPTEKPDEDQRGEEDRETGKDENRPGLERVSPRERKSSSAARTRTIQSSLLRKSIESLERAVAEL